MSFLTFAEPARRAEVANELRRFCTRPVVLAARGNRNRLSGALHKMLGAGYSLITGLKRSNYLIGVVEFERDRLRKEIDPSGFDCVLYEYIHAAPSVPLFRSAGVPTVVDTHNVLWRARESELRELPYYPAAFRRRQLEQYRRAEEKAWRCFDGLIAINRAEQQAIQEQVIPQQKVFYAPMGVNLSLWPYSWNPAAPPRIAYYGGLGSPHNQKAALRCIQQLMPAVWAVHPTVEFWVVGSNPPAHLVATSAPPRINITGFLPDVQKTLNTMSLVLCPWEGNYGFRSRVVETMALGVPMVATPEAVDGMELESGKGILLGRTDSEMSRAVLSLLSNPSELARQSRIARAEMERLYSFESTYGRLVKELAAWIPGRAKR